MPNLPNMPEKGKSKSSVPLDNKPPAPPTVTGWMLAYEGNGEELVTLDRLETILTKTSESLEGMAYLLDKLIGYHLHILQLDADERGFFMLLIDYLRMSGNRLLNIAPNVPNLKVDYVPAADESA